MKKLICLFFIILCLTACGNTQTENPDTLKAAVISAPDSVTAKNAYNLLTGSAVAALTAERVDASLTKDIKNYDIVYVDKSVASSPSFDAKAVEEFVEKGGSVFLDNETYDLFDKDFIGAEDFVPIDGCPVDMQFHEYIDSGMRKVQGVIKDFCELYPDYANYSEALAPQSYGVGVIPSTASCITSRDGLGLYTLNEYGSGYVFFTNPLLPNAFSVNNLSVQDTGAPLAITTVGANKLIRDYFAEFVSLKKYGYAVENVFGSFARPAAAWELPIKDIAGIENGSAEIFEDMCRKYGQIPSFSLARNPYTEYLRAESVTYALSDNGKYSMDAYENAYSSGTHFVSESRWITLDYDNDTAGYFDDSTGYVKRAYPCPVDYNNDKIMDLICGSADGGIYLFEGIGMGENYELGEKQSFKDADGNMINVGAFSSPCVADMDGDGDNEIITGSETGEIHCYKNLGNGVLEYVGILMETGLTDAMPSCGDLNGDGIPDIAVGSRGGEMRVYYGDMGLDGVTYNEYENIDTWALWSAPCIADADGDGINELYAGTDEGYIEAIKNNVFAYYLEGSECNYMGNNNLKFGTNCVPRFYDIDGDGFSDLIAGSLEYGMAVPIDSEYFPYKDELKNQLDGFTERGIYVGVNMLSHEHADRFHDRRELLYHSRAFEAYGIPFEGGANQHTWFTSKVGYDAHYDNMQGYDGTYSEQRDSGLLWNSGSRTPASQASPVAGAENTVPVPFYLDNGLLLLQPSNAPNGSSFYSHLAAKYETPLLCFERCDDVYKDRQSAEEKIKKVYKLTGDYGYSFVQENQLAKMTAAALNTHVNAKWENDTLYLSSETREKDIPLYDKDYQKAAGVKVIFADNVIAEEFNVDASVSYKKDNCIYVSLDRNAKISKSGENNDINITAVNVPADISKNKNKATVKFKDGGMMAVSVKGIAKTNSKGWEVTQEDGVTVFRKYGKAQTLKITK